MKILIVEDHPLIALSLADELTSAGHEVIGPASTSMNAFEAISRCNIEFAFVDVDLERRGVGLSVARHLHLRQACSVVLTTGRPEVAIDCHCAAAVLSKPYNLQQIPAIVDALELRRQGLASPHLPSSLQLLPPVRADRPFASTSAQAPILLVDDHPSDIELVTTALTKCPISNPVVVVRDGVEAIRYFETPTNPPPAAMLLDLKMPRMDGHEVLRRVRLQPALHSLPIVMLTASNHESDSQKSYEYGADDYLVKPSSPDHLREALTCLSRYGIVGESHAPR